MILSIPEFILTLKQNLDYYSSVITSKIFILTTAMGDIIITPSIYEFCHLQGGASFPRCNNIKALEFVEAVKLLHHEDEKTYEFLNIPKLLEEVQKEKTNFPMRTAYLKVLYLQKALDSFVHPKEKRRFYIFAQNESKEDFNTDYLYLYNGDDNFPIYLGIIGKRENPNFVFNSLYIDSNLSFKKRGFVALKVHDIQMVDYTSANLENAMNGKVFISKHYLEEKKKKEKKNSKAKNQNNKEKNKSTSQELTWSITSDRFYKELTREVRAIDRRFSVKYGSSTKSSFKLLYDNKKTPINLKIPEDLKTPTQVAKFLTDQYYERQQGDQKRNSKNQKNKQNPRMGSNAKNKQTTNKNNRSNKKS